MVKSQSITPTKSLTLELMAEKEFSAKVPLEEYLAFKERFPQYGAVNWFINTALATFNRTVESIPESSAVVNHAIRDMLAARRVGVTDD